MILAATLTTLGLLLLPQSDASQSARNKWLRLHALAMKGVEAEQGLEDLAGLKDMIGAARVVGLGEGTHGTREYFQMKHRLVEYLVKELGFSIFAIEANMPEAQELDAYVLGGEGDVNRLIAGMYFWTWNTEEVRDMVEWMRRFNAAETASGSPRRIHFTGFDMQTGTVALRKTRTFLKAHDAELEKRHAATLDELVKFDGESDRVPFRARTETDPRKLQGKLRALLDRMRSSRKRYAATVGGERAKWAIQDAEVVQQWLGLMTNPGGCSSYRDDCMAANVQWLAAENPEAKIVLWAHNGHVQDEQGWMGSTLRRTFGKRYLNVAFTSSRGTYYAPVWRTREYVHPLKEPPRDSFEALLEASGLPRCIVDLRQGRKGDPGSKWLTECHPFGGNIGALPMEEHYIAENLSKHYDLLVYVRETSAARQLSTAAGRH